MGELRAQERRKGRRAVSLSKLNTAEVETNLGRVSIEVGSRRKVNFSSLLRYATKKWDVGNILILSLAIHRRAGWDFTVIRIFSSNWHRTVCN